jgi:hypothetical protein
VAALIIRGSDSLAEESRHLLAGLAQWDWGSDFYLAGSAALTLYLQHRPVRDLDLMSPVRRLQANERRDLLQDLLRLDDEIRVETARDGFLYVRSGSGVAVRLYYYPYPLVQAEEPFIGVAVASPVDLGLMKLGAVISRGTRRDFVDLFLLCREVSLARLLEHSLDKFGHVGDFALQAFKGLADLSQIDGEPMPRLSRSVSWAEVDGWLHGEVRSLARQYVGLDQDEEE